MQKLLNNRNIIKNYIKLSGSFPFSLWRSYYCFIDTEDYLADALFIRHKVTVHFGKEYQKEGKPYFLIFCWIKKKDEVRFLMALDDLKNKMLLCGHTDYQTFCEQETKDLLATT